MSSSGDHWDLEENTGFLIIQLWSWFNTLLKRVHFSILWNYNELKLKSVTYYSLHADFS